MTTSVFMGTPEAALPTLKTLRHLTDIALVITRPDRPRGRHRRLQPPPVKEAATALGLPVAQPERSADLAALLAGVGRVDVGVVVAFGMILRPEVLAIPRRGFLNVHFSHLPRWRGAAPVERAIMAGDQTTGVTIMAMDEGLDTGDIVAARTVPIAPSATGGELTDLLAEEGAGLLAETLVDWVEGRIVATPQSARGAGYAHKVGPEDRRLGPDLATEDFVNTVRALAPDPGAQLDVDGAPHKILAVGSAPLSVETGRWAELAAVPVLGLADGAVAILTIQPPGKRPMSGEAWLRGRPLPTG